MPREWAASHWPLGNGLDPGPDNFGDVGTFEDGQGEERGKECREVLRSRQADGHKVYQEVVPAFQGGPDAAVGQKMVADEKIDDEDDHQGRQVAHGLHVGAADQAQEHHPGRAADAHDRT